jgi:hypothetical protein
MQEPPITKRQGHGHSGRKPGSRNRSKQEIIDKAKAAGELPHEFLLRVVQNRLAPHEMVGDDGTLFEVVPLEMRIEAATKCASFFAPKLSSVEVISSLTDNDLDTLIKELATQAGLGNALGRESQEDDDEVRVRRSVTAGVRSLH